MDFFTLPAFAKINWFLKIRGRRSDGFHELCTLFQIVSLHDELSFSLSDRLTVTCDDPTLSVGEDNLVVRAARLVQARTGVLKGASIRLTKNIPIQGGLGGGSSDAATAIIGLIRLWDLEIDQQSLLDWARELGSDVPFFLFGGTAVGGGRGTDIVPVEDIEESFLLVVAPQIAISTALAFAGLNAPVLTKESSKSTLEVCCQEARTFSVRQPGGINDFETSVFAIEPEIKRVRDKLISLKAKFCMLSGSGSSVFAVFDNEETRQASIEALINEKWRVFAVATVSREVYRETLRLFPISF
jgi:4-diphosphocytidyl-2-C-methyl-D-erythritol kinase